MDDFEWIIDSSKIVGQGSFGTVYEAFPLGLSRESKKYYVAKVQCLITEDDHKRFQEEIKCTQVASKHQIGPKFFSWICCNAAQVPWMSKKLQQQDLEGNVVHHPWITLYWKKKDATKWIIVNEKDKEYKNVKFGIFILERLYLLPQKFLISHKQQIIKILETELKKLFQIRLWNNDLYSGNNLGFIQIPGKGTRSRPKIELRIWDWGKVNQEQIPEKEQLIYIHDIIESITHENSS
jgi:hypothetical protein